VAHLGEFSSAYGSNTRSAHHSANEHSSLPRKLAALVLSKYEDSCFILTSGLWTAR
jgi:hypothetical protein